MRHWCMCGLLLFLALCQQGLAGAQTLMAHVNAEVGPHTWTYTLFNDEPINSPNYITSFFLSVDAPITIAGSPAAWDYQTDGISYVFWFNNDTALPYPHDIAPGSALSGFQIESVSETSQLLYVGLTAWDHTADALGAMLSGAVISPSAPAVPEANGWALFMSLILAGSLLMWRNRILYK